MSPVTTGANEAGRQNYFSKFAICLFARDAEAVVGEWGGAIGVFVSVDGVELFGEVFEVFLESGAVDFAGALKIVFFGLGFGLFFDFGFVGDVTGARTVEIDVTREVIDG